ncbi:MAG: hypothetical protein AAB725_02475, partial [Patescibacteria group bacterium]
DQSGLLGVGGLLGWNPRLEGAAGELARALFAHVVRKGRTVATCEIHHGRISCMMSFRRKPRD